MTASRAMALAALFVTGTIAGAAAVALASSASSSPPSLVAGSLLSSDSENSAEGFVTLTIDVFNSSEADLPVMVRSFAGWPVSETDAEVLPARAWTQLEITTAPDCEEVLTEVMAVDVGSYPLDVSLDPGIGGILRRVRDEFAGWTPTSLPKRKSHRLPPTTKAFAWIFDFAGMGEGRWATCRSSTHTRASQAALLS